MIDLKSLSHEAIPGALEKADWYRLLNDPHNAESICRDVLMADPDNSHARVTLILALSDQFADGLTERFNEARKTASQLPGDYEQRYYSGIVCERRARSRFERGGPEAGSMAYEWFREAMDHFEAAEQARPEGNDESILRWNACARMLMSHRNIKKQDEGVAHPIELE